MMATAKRMLAFGCAVAILFAACCTLGLLMMPRWSAEPYRDHITIASADTAIAPRDAHIAHQGAYATRERHITIHLEDGEGDVPAILREPVGVDGAHPACLFVHGSGTGTAEDFGDIANAMSSAGIITLVPAKRTDGYTPAHRDYARFARDYGTALDLLRAMPGVDAARTGVYAESEGTWIATLMTSERRDIAFAILTSAPVYTGREQMAMAVSASIHAAGAPTAVVRDAAKLMSMDYAPFDFRYADFDADAVRGSLTMPLLVNYGTYDTAMPIEQGARTLVDTAARHGNRNVTVRYYAANHQLRAGKGLFTQGLPLAEGYTRDLADWVNGVAAGTDADGWATPRIAGATPRQRVAAPRHGTASGIIGSLAMLVGLIAAAVLCFVVAGAGGTMFLVFEMVRRRRLAMAAADGMGTGRERFPALGRRGRTVAPWPGTGREFARMMGYPHGLKALLVAGALTSLGVMLALGGYLSYVGVAALHEQRDPQGMTWGFTALRGGAAVVLLLTAWLIVRLWRAWRVRRAAVDHGLYPTGRRVRSSWMFGRWHWVMALLVLAGMLLTLTVLAFWGLFTA
ncbi:alpha/beta hydrolase [Bifidobacterium sp. CP2]|uniref:alpha/beta hydrolase family protein n=1 Tax=Bifidobacterium sp. CP2 TaxID=2809025 RepID=UPI001BDC19DC|nr:alpha/beta hydrolase [Bifidobacterium sp. CP2]MBT1181569.1 alpha/beta hydrolase [Bifidobacterium sp. CP2]